MSFRKVELYPSEEKQAVPKISPLLMPNHNLITPVLEKDLNNIEIKENLMNIFSTNIIIPLYIMLNYLNNCLNTNFSDFYCFI